MLTFSSESVDDTFALGERLAHAAAANDIILLTGDLGAGKTHFAKGFAQGLGVDDEITSPTFNILIEYLGDELPLFHFDLYRLETNEELEDIDFFGMLESGAVSLVEWGDKFPDALGDEYLEVKINTNPDETRVIEVTGFGARGAALEAALA